MRGKRKASVISPTASGPIHQTRRAPKRNKVMRPREGAAETTKKTTKARMKAMTSETNPRETILVGESLHLETRAKATVTRVLVRSPAKLANHVCSMRGETVALEKIVNPHVDKAAPAPGGAKGANSENSKADQEDANSDTGSKTKRRRGRKKTPAAPAIVKMLVVAAAASLCPSSSAHVLNRNVTMCINCPLPIACPAANKFDLSSNE